MKMLVTDYQSPCSMYEPHLMSLVLTCSQHHALNTTPSAKERGEKENDKGITYDAVLPVCCGKDDEKMERDEGDSSAAG